MSGIVHISEALSLALHGMGIIASCDRKVSVREIAEKTWASEAHLAKVFQRLARAGLINSTRGPRGGLELAGPSSSITLYDIYSVIEGTPDRYDCLMPDIHCPFRQCIFGDLLGRLNSEFVTHLRDHTLEDLVHGKMKYKGES